MDKLGSSELGEGVSYQSLLHVSSNQNWYSNWTSLRDTKYIHRLGTGIKGID